MNPEWHAVVQEGNGESVHISSHPAVKTENEHNAARRQERLVIRNDIDDAYGRALKNANKSPKQPIFGRTKSTSSSSSSNMTIMGSRGDDHADHWGKTLPLAGPWASETVVSLAPQMYPAPPGIIHTAPGQPGACAAGTCGGSTGCGSGAVALCGAGCSGVSLFFFFMPVSPTPPAISSLRLGLTPIPDGPPHIYRRRSLRELCNGWWLIHAAEAQARRQEGFSSSGFAALKKHATLSFAVSGAASVDFAELSFPDLIFVLRLMVS